MRLDLGGLVPALSGWTLCIDEHECHCTICVELPEWARGLSRREKVYLALYLAARTTMDYRVAAAMHIYAVRSRIALRPELLVKALRESRVLSKTMKAIDSDSPYAWEATLYKGIVYANQILSLDRPVLVKVEPPKDKRERERLRVLLEGKRVTVKGRTYRVNGLVKRLGGERIAPWIYLVPRRNLPKLLENMKGKTKTTIMTI